MFKLFRKLKYGDTTKFPKYIEKKNKWLYKNKWYTYNGLCYQLDLKNIFTFYHYEFRNQDGYYDSFEVDNFNKIIEKLLEDPFKIRFPYPNEFDKKQHQIINTIIYKAVKDYNNKIVNKLKDFQDQMLNQRR